MEGKYREDPNNLYYSLFSAEYFPGTSILLALFDVDFFWKKEGNEWENEQLKHIKGFCDIDIAQDFKSKSIEALLFRNFASLLKGLRNSYGNKTLSPIKEDVIDQAISDFKRSIRKPLNEIVKEDLCEFCGRCIYKAVIENFIQERFKTQFKTEFDQNLNRYKRINKFYNIKERSKHKSEKTVGVLEMGKEGKEIVDALGETLEESILGLNRSVASLEEGIKNKEVNLDEVKRSAEDYSKIIGNCIESFGQDPRFAYYQKRVDRLIEMRKSMGDWDKPEREPIEEHLKRISEILKDVRPKPTHVRLDRLFIEDEDGNLIGL